MGVDLHVMFAAALTADEAFALPEKLNGSEPVSAASLYYHEKLRAEVPGLTLVRWHWDDEWTPVSDPSSLRAAWASPYLGSVSIHGTPGLLWVSPKQVRLSALQKFSGFAADYIGCQDPIRRVCRAIANELGTDRVLYLPDFGDWSEGLGDLENAEFDDALARLTSWGPPVPLIGALGYGRAVRSGYHYADGALRRPDGTPVPEDEICPGRYWMSSGGVTCYYDGRPVPAEELARPDLRGGFAYFLDDFRDLR